MVDLDDGHISVPSTVVVLQLPDQLKGAVEDALSEVLHPSIKQRDYVFTQDLITSRSVEIEVITLGKYIYLQTCTCTYVTVVSTIYVLYLQDREVRAVFLCMFVHLLADYQDYITAIRFHPHPAFAFRKVRVYPLLYFLALLFLKAISFILCNHGAFNI